MLPWFFREPRRLEEERQAIESLARTTDWLIGHSWQLTGGLVLDAVIRAHGHDYQVRVEFPSLYPIAPSVVRPVNAEQRLSQHQYGGADGPLCLEWGPDNWRREITAAQMLESTHLLLATENPLGDDKLGPPAAVESRHLLSVGQELRARRVRWYFSDALRRHVSEQPASSGGGLMFSMRDLGSSHAVLVHELHAVGLEAWKDATIPGQMPGAKASERLNGVWLRAAVDSADLSGVSTLDELRAVLNDAINPSLLATDGSSPAKELGSRLSGILIATNDTNAELFLVLSSGEAIRCARVSSEDHRQDRDPSGSLALRDKTIGVVGLGAVGSKVAVSLGRMGCQKFVLVDHDILLPENLRRHALDWQSVTQHKANAVSRALQFVEPSIQSEVSDVHLTGQESNAVVGGILDKLAECDVIVDATASSRAFNLLAAVSSIARRAFVWCEVYGGGVGGMIARSRPGMEPTPQDMRALYLQFCADNPAPEALRAAVNYAQESGDGSVLIAADPEVSIIAHHAARLAADSVLDPGESIFPNSMYLIGMQQTWIFQAPFATVPIATDSIWPATSGPSTELGITRDTMEFLTGLLDKAQE